MRIGIPAEVKNHEYRVAITPAGVRELVLNGHEIFVQAGAGTGSSITDAEYQAAGAQVLPAADDVWGAGGLILRVKEPIAEEYGRMREGQVLFTYLHLAADKRLTEELIARKVTGIAYETVQTPDGALPLLAPMSEVAGARAAGAGVGDEARLSPGRHLHRPGRLLRGLVPDHARPPDLHGAQLGLLLRRQHAGRRAEHLHPRPDQRHPALRGRAGQQGLAAGLRRRRQPGPRRQHPRRPPGQHRRRRGHRPGHRLPSAAC